MIINITATVKLTIKAKIRTIVGIKAITNNFTHWIMMATIKIANQVEFDQSQRDTILLREKFVFYLQKTRPLCKRLL